MISVLIADDLCILRQGIKAVIEQDHEIQVVAQASDGEEAFLMCQQYHPDVVLMDMRMPGTDGEYGIHKIKERYPDIHILVLTTFDDDETVSSAISSGADGYILKEMENNKIIQSVKAVYNGINVLGPNVYSGLQKKILNSHQTKTNSDNNDICRLTEREKDIIILISEGMDNRNIASRLFLAEGTVRNNISRMLDKLGLKDRTQLAVYAVKNNIR